MSWQGEYIDPYQSWEIGDFVEAMIKEYTEATTATTCDYQLACMVRFRDLRDTLNRFSRKEMDT